MKYLEALLRKQAVFIISANPHIKVEQAYEAWKLEGEEQQKKASSKLLKFLRDYKAKDIISRKAQEYEKAQKRLNGRRTKG